MDMAAAAMAEVYSCDVMQEKCTIISKIAVHKSMAVDAMGTNRPTTIDSIVVDDAGGVVGLPRTAYDGCLLQKQRPGLRPERFTDLMFC